MTKKSKKKSMFIDGVTKHQIYKWLREHPQKQYNSYEIAKALGTTSHRVTSTLKHIGNNHVCAKKIYDKKFKVLKREGWLWFFWYDSDMYINIDGTPKDTKLVR